MQVANTLNNNIRILFNPNIESFKLFDFLLVKSSEDNYLAQILEIYDDKFDASQNVAKLKLFYKITKDNNVLPYDGFCPNKECEILKIKQEEIESFINQGKKTFSFAENAKDENILQLQYDFFNNNAIIIADKVENSCNISCNLAKNLSEQKPVVLIDLTGVMELKDANRLVACKNFRLPLNFSTIDFIFDKCLADAPLEFQTVCGDIINEIKKFAKKQEQEFIPFNSFLRVLLDQYEATPCPELKLLISRLKKYQISDIFAKTKKENLVLEQSIEKNQITIIDLSSLDSFWVKAFVENIIDSIKNDAYLISRINDENCDIDLINKIYNLKRNISFIPSVSYNYKKLPSVAQYCKNYILLPSLYQRGDFLDANFALANLIQTGCIIFGENTDNFIYLATNYELKTPEEVKKYKKIALSLINEDKKIEEQAEKENQAIYEENAQKEIIAQQLSNFSASINELEADNAIIKNNFIDEEDEFQEITNFQQETSSKDETIAEETTETTEEIVEKENSYKTFETTVEETEKIEEIKDSEEDIFENLEASPIQENIQENKEETISQEQETSFSDILNEEKEENTISPDEKNEQDEDLISFDVPQHEETISNLDDVELSEMDDSQATQEENTVEEIAKEDNKNEEDMDLSDEELDFFQLAKESSIAYEKDNVQTTTPENDTTELQALDDDIQEESEIQDIIPQEDVDLKEIANNSINTSFEQIVDTKTIKEENNLKIDNTTQINIANLTKPEKESNLPIFKENIKKNAKDFKVGLVVTHKKYGTGTIVKIIKYEERQLLQIAFEEAGKKLLDPTVAEISVEN